MIEQVTFEITGISPLLMHNPASMSKPGDKKSVSAKQIPSPEEEAEAACYRNDKGQFYMQAIAFRGSIINPGGGASGRKIGKTTANSRCAAGISINEKFDKCVLINLKTRKPLTEYKIDTRRAVVQKNGIMRSRPRLEEWACDLVFDIDTDFVTIEQVVELLNISGRIAGVGDYRPQKKGWFGKYKAELKTSGKK